MSKKRPNILLIMSDEHDPKMSSVYGHSFVQTPNMQRLADEGVAFDNFYCNSPLCVPSRMSMMTGQYPSQIESYDLASSLSSDQPTLAHFLNSAGYDTVLSGKMHFVGPDQLHGFKTRLVEDIHGTGRHYAADWTAEVKPNEASRKRITNTGRPDDGSARHIQYDKRVFQTSRDYLKEYANSQQEQPFFLSVGFFAPHFPLVCEERYWDLYWPKHGDLPTYPETPDHPMYHRFKEWFGLSEPFDQEQIRKCRAAYYGLVSFMDDHIGGLMEVLEHSGLMDDTIVIYTSDHGETLGERGLWWKNSFLERSSRVPMIIRWPDSLPRGERINQVASLIDLAPTLLEFAGAEVPDFLQGDSLLPLIDGSVDNWKNSAFIEYLAHGTDRPLCSLRKGRFKLNYALGEPCELYDIEADPNELTNLIGEAFYEEIANNLIDEIESRWDGEGVRQAVLKSQKLRRHMQAGERIIGRFPPKK